MPRPRRQHSDIWAWAWDRHGLFSVRSAYRKLSEQQNSDDHLASNADGKEASWKALWRLQVMPKIRIFWWRVMKNLLPSCGEMRRRHMKETSNCPLCGHEMETLFHALVECDHARMFWSMAKEHFGLKVPNLHPATWTEDILDHKVVSKRDAAVAISIMWTIWGRAGIAITMGKFSINHRNLSNWSRSC